MTTLTHYLTNIRQILVFRNLDLSPKEQYRANLLRIIIYANLLATMVLILFGIFGTVSDPTAGFIIAFIMTSVNFWALRRLNQGRLTTVSRLIVGMAWFFVALSAYSSGGLYSSAMMGMMGLIVTGILLLDKKARIIIYIATIVFYFILLYIEVSGHLPYAPFKDLPFRVIVLSSTLTTLFLVINYHLYAFHQSEELTVKFQVDAERYRVQRDLTQDLTHDLRTPLSTIMTSVYLIRKRQEKGLPIDDTLLRLERQSERLDSLIEDLFQMTLLDDSDTQKNLKLINLSNLIQSCIDDAAHYASTQNIDLSFTNDSDDTKPMVGDRSQLKRIFDNLIENAIHYGRENGTVTMSLSSNESQMIFVIKDDGIGIAPENHDKIFERFYRVDSARTARPRQGAGVGLNAVQRIVQLHGGEVLLESELGKGSTFKVYLPYLNPIKDNIPTENMD